MAQWILGKPSLVPTEWQLIQKVRIESVSDVVRCRSVVESAIVQVGIRAGVVPLRRTAGVDVAEILRPGVVSAEVQAVRVTLHDPHQPRIIIRYAEGRVLD